MGEPKYILLADVFAEWEKDLLSGETPTEYQVGRGGFQFVHLAPQRVVLIGSPPAYGKTALTMQLAVDALRFNSAIRLLICNVEMPYGVLLDRQLARLAGVDASIIQYRRFRGSQLADKIAQGRKILNGLAGCCKE